MNVVGFTNRALQVLAPLKYRPGFEVVEKREGEAFDNALVTAQAPPLGIRMIRERGKEFADVGPLDFPDEWYDAAFIAELLGDPRPSYIAPEGGVLLDRFAQFVEENFDELSRRFQREELPRTRSELREIKRASARRRFGYDPGGGSAERAP